jgi:hypothetical protein
MHWFETKRWLRTIAAGSLVLLAAGCGGGDTSPTGPGGGGNGGGGGGGGNDTGIAGEYQLLSIGHIALPADLTFEQCDPVRIAGGRLEIHDNNTWVFALATQDGNGNDQFEDEGQVQEDGLRLLFESADYGDSFHANFDGAVMKMDYDWCPDGQTDIQLVFGK